MNQVCLRALFYLSTWYSNPSIIKYRLIAGSSMPEDENYPPVATKPESVYSKRIPQEYHKIIDADVSLPRRHPRNTYKCYGSSMKRRDDDPTAFRNMLTDTVNSSTFYPSYIANGPRVSYPLHVRILTRSFL